VKVLEDLPVPHMTKDVGFRSYYGRFVPHFAQLAVPLCALMGKAEKSGTTSLTPPCGVDTVKFTQGGPDHHGDNLDAYLGPAPAKSSS